MIFRDIISTLISLFLWFTLRLDTCDMPESHLFTYRITQHAQNSAIYQYVPFKCLNLCTKMNDILQENNWPRKFDLGTKLITKYGPLWGRHPDFPWSHNLFTEVELLHFHLRHLIARIPSRHTKHLNSHLFPWQPFCSSVQFSFPFRDSLFGPFRTIRLKHSLKLKIMFTEIDSLWKSGFPAGLTK